MKLKNLSLVLLASAMVFQLAACGGVEEKAGTSEDGVYEILWHDRGAVTPDHNLVYEEVNKYLKEKIGATVKNVPFVGAEYTEKMRLVLASKEAFDICFSSSGSNYEVNAANGAYLEIEELLNAHGRDTLAITPEYAIKAAKINGVLYALPAYKDYAQENVFYYRADLADKYNLPMDTVKTLADLEPILRTIKKNEPGIYTLLILPSLSPFKMLPFEEISGGIIGSIDHNGDPNKIINPYETKEAMEYFKTMRRFYEQGFLRPEVATLTSNDDVADGFMSVQQELPYLVDQRNKTLPYKQRVLHLQKPVLTTATVRGSMVSIGKNSKNPVKSMEFLNLLNTDPYLRNLIAYGIEGKHYIAVGDSQYKLPEGCSTKDDTGYSTYVYTQGNKYITRMIEGTPADIFDKYKEFDDNAFKSPALGFAFDPSELKTEYTAVSNAYNEFMPALLTGTVDPEEVLPRALDKLKKAGLDKLLEEMQRQYDEWRAIAK